MDFNQIKKVATSLSKLIDDNEKIALPVFANKLSKASATYPEDKTIGMMSDVISRMASNKKIFITRAEIKDLYNRLFSRNTKFPELFKDELGQMEKLAGAKIYNREHDDESYTLLNKAYDKVVDPILSNALNVAFGNNSKTYTDSAAELAKSVCNRKCATTKLAYSIDISNGNENFIICRVAFETPKGQTSVYIPVEFSAGKALLPSIFIGNNGPEDFRNLENYAVKQAGQKLNINDKAIFAAINNVKNGDITKISNVDIALTKLNTQKETKSDYFANGIYYQKTVAEDKNLVVKTPTYKDDEIDSFANKFDSARGVASFRFGEDKINLGRTIIANKLESYGLGNSQISVCDSDKTSIVYAVSLNAGKLAFRVPIRVQDNKIIDPVILISNGAIESFSKEGLNSLLNKNVSDYKTAAVASPLYGLKPSELVQIIREAMLEQNFVKAEDTLNVLAESGDEKAYKTAFTIYTNGLNSDLTEKNECKCSMVVKNASSKYPLCGHTGLPLYKVYTDKNGDCHPLYRKGMEDTQEGAYFLNSKIFF
jgi:hypothetical protein